MDDRRSASLVVVRVASSSSSDGVEWCFCLLLSVFCAKWNVNGYDDDDDDDARADLDTLSLLFSVRVHYSRQTTTTTTEIGIGLIAFGCGFTTLGVFLFFDRALLAMGNLMFLTGVTTTIGPRATVKFFVKPRNQRGAFCFLLGLLLVLMKWAVVGMIIECYGFFALFAGFFPTVLLFLQRVPVLGTMLRFPGLNQFVKKIVKKGQRLPVWSSSRSQRYSILLVERKNEKKGKEKFVRARARFFNAGTRRFRFRDVLSFTTTF